MSTSREEDDAELAGEQKDPGRGVLVALLRWMDRGAS